MAESLISTSELAMFLGVDEEDNKILIEAMRASAIESLCKQSGIDWTNRRERETFREAVRTMVWISFYAVRDASKNTTFLHEYLTGLICELQLSGEESNDV